MSAIVCCFQVQQFWRFLIPYWNTCASVLTLNWAIGAVQQEVPLSAQPPRRVMRGLSRMLLFKQLVSNEGITGSLFKFFLPPFSQRGGTKTDLELERNKGEWYLCICVKSQAHFTELSSERLFLYNINWSGSQEAQRKLKCWWNCSKCVSSIIMYPLKYRHHSVPLVQL